jgi:thiosulfate/3-mercaptopyruvate sulfurtransferase
MPFTTLISTAELSAHLADRDLVIVDCRFALDDVEWGRRAYAEAHIPGAAYADLNDDLAGPRTGANGRHPLPDPEVFRRVLGRLGIAEGVQVVAYDQSNGMYASRLWWMLRWMGHDAVAVLDGGMGKWVADGFAVVAGIEIGEVTVFVGGPREDVVLSVEEVAPLVGRPGWRLLDARAAERYRGDVEPLDRVAGHIPGALNHFYQSNLSDDGTFRAPDGLRAAFVEVLGDAAVDRVVCYCGSGVTACHNLLALEHAGLRGAKLYAGSWSEWSSDPARPVERS